LLNKKFITEAWNGLELCENAEDQTEQNTNIHIHVYVYVERLRIVGMKCFERPDAPYILFVCTWLARRKDEETSTSF
jgi:hypothetical protein